MKRFLFSLVALIITSVCFAQDIIVQKDGNTITAKVLKVSQSEVEYKKFGNQDGPTYTISTKNLQRINYQNGTSDTFVSPNYDPTIVTNETATQFSNDQQLMKLYNQENNPLKKAKKLRVIGYAIGGTLSAFGVIGLATTDWGQECKASTAAMFGGMLALGIASATTLHFVGKSIQKKTLSEIYSTVIYQQEFNIGKNNRLMVGVDMLKDNTRRNQTLGLGVSYNF